MQLFQSTRPRGARHLPGADRHRLERFQSTRPRGARPMNAVTSRASRWFQSTRPRGARLVTVSTLPRPRSFNPRAHAGRDHRVIGVGRRFSVSIHAPTRGATDRNPVSRMKNQFQSTRPRGARLDAIRAQDVVQPVSIHAPTRGATWGARLVNKRGMVSIHAPTRGATYRATLSPDVEVFQSTRPRGARPLRSGFRHLSTLFQSTRPRGARHSAHQVCRPATGFNPRAHAGRDSPH